MKSTGKQHGDGVGGQQQLGMATATSTTSSAAASPSSNSSMAGGMNCGGLRFQRTTSAGTYVPYNEFQNVHRVQPIHGHYLTIQDINRMRGCRIPQTSMIRPTVACAQLSLSGSETDVSTTSTENLTCEEKYVLRNSTRQEPQGEESLQLETGQLGSGITSADGGHFVRHINYSSLDQSSCCSTIVVHKGTDGDADDDDEVEDEDEYERNLLNSKLTNSSPGVEQNVGHRSHQTLTANSNEQSASRLSHEQASSSGNNNNNNNITYCTGARLPCNTETTGIKNVHQVVSSSTYPASASINCSDSIDFDMSKLPPPPEYPGWLQSELSSASAHEYRYDEADENVNTFAASGCIRGSRTGFVSEVLAGSLSRSQPDLRSLGRWNETCVNAVGCTYSRKNDQHPSYRPRTKSGIKASTDPPPANLLYQRVTACNKYRSQGDLHGDDDDDDDNRGRHASQHVRNRHLHRQDSSKLAEMAGNRQLKCEFDSTSYKVYKLEKFEAEIQKAHEAHEELVKSSQKREELEQKVKIKLQLELRKYQETNRELKTQLDAANGQLLIGQQSLISAGEYIGVDSIRELQHRDAFVAQLIQQNKELLAAKERHEIELAAQRATLCEQRTHIDILDSALTNAQANVVKLEEECRKKQAYVERVGQLQRALAALQVASERRDEMARKLRGQLEKDIQLLRQQLKQQQQHDDDKRKLPVQTDSLTKTNVCSAAAIGIICSGDTQQEELGVDDLKRMAREQEERIIALETEVSKWEQRYLEENAMRQIAIDAASMPKDAKIAALEHTSQENEKLIAQAHSDKLRHMDEVHVANKHCADLDARVRDLESRLAERDAMIRVLQKHSIDKDVAYQSAYQLRSPRHTPHTSFHTVDHGGCSSSSTITTTQAVTADSTPDDVRRPRSSAVKLSSSSSNISASKESLDEQLKKLESQLLSKDSIIQALRSEKEKYPNHYWMV